MSDFHALSVREIRRETGGAAVSLVFDVPAALKEAFAWRPGQHVTVRFHLGGEEARRCYSISSSPFSNDGLCITVKRVTGGLISNHINDSVKPGDTLDIMAPFGGFCLDPGDTLRRTHYFFGAGSGITPLYAMLHSVLLAEPYSVVHLFYGNAHADTIIFRDRLAALQEAYADRLTVSHALSSASSWSGFRPWRRGRIDRSAVEAAIIEYPPYAQDTQYYICGPGAMNTAVKAALMDLDVPTGRIRMESYSGDVEADTSVAGMAATARIRLNDTSHRVAIAEGQTVLEAAWAAGLSPPYSCQSGVCGACRARLQDGAVHMRSRIALEETDLAAGAILTCQAVAAAPELALAYE